MAGRLSKISLYLFKVFDLYVGFRVQQVTGRNQSLVLIPRICQESQ